MRRQDWRTERLQNPAAQIAVVSELGRDLPPLRADRIYTAEIDDGGLIEIIPIPNHAGYYYVAVHYAEAVNDVPHVRYMKRGFKLNPEIWPLLKGALDVTLASEWSEEPLRNGEPWYISTDRLAATRRKRLYDLLIQEAESRKSKESRVSGRSLAELAASIKAKMAMLEENFKGFDATKSEIMEMWDSLSEKEQEQWSKRFKLMEYLRPNSKIELNDDELHELILVGETADAALVPAEQ